MTQVLCLDLKIHLFILTGTFLFNGPPLLTLRSWESWIEENMTSKAHYFKNAMRVYATALICSTGVLGFHTFKFALCICNKLRLHAEILSWWAFDVTFPKSNPLRSNRSGLNVSNGGSWNPKFTLEVNSFWMKIKGQNFASQVLSRHTFKIPRKKGSDFFITGAL